MPSTIHEARKEAKRFGVMHPNMDVVIIHRPEMSLKSGLRYNFRFKKKEKLIRWGEKEW